MEKIVSNLSADGYFIGPCVADESPMEPGVFLLPAGAVDVEPPTVPPGTRAKFNGTGFDFEDIPEPPEPPAPTPEQIAAAVTAARGNAYRIEADPLFFKAQRGEATMDEWLAKVAEIKARFPDGVMPS